VAGTSDLEKALCSLICAPTVDDGTPQTWRHHFRKQGSSIPIHQKKSDSCPKWRAYIALWAFDDALNLAALRRATEELQSKNDRLQLLLDVTNQVVSNLEPP